MADTGMGFRGRSGVISLVRECLAELPGTDRPVTMLLGPRGCGASQAHGELMGQFGKEVPFAYVNFAADQPLLPRYVLGLLARQLERKLPQYRISRFPRLTLGLLASDDELRIVDRAAGRRAVERELRSFQDAAEARYGDYLAAFLEVAGSALGVPDGTPAFASAILRDTARRGRRWLPALPGRRFTDSADWYVGHPLMNDADPWDALLDLNMWRHTGTAEEKERLDRVLFSAFLADARENTARSFAPRSCLILLDNCHTDYGRRFLDLLIRARHDAVVSGAPCDPLTVVGSANQWLPRWGPATGDQWQWRLRGPDRASLADWREDRPPHSGDDSWWYPLRLRDLNRDEVQTRVELKQPAHGELAPFIHRLTCGLPRAVHQVLEVLRNSDAPATDGVGRDLWLRSLPDRLLRDGEQTRTLLDSALDDLLHDFSAAERTALTECAAALDLSAGSRALAAGDSLFTKVRSRWLLLSPGTMAPTLHPWLRRLLLWRLAHRTEDWDTVHNLLREHFAEQQRTVQEMYHRLAAHRVEEVADHLALRFQTVPTAQWISEFNAITSAPGRHAVDRGPLALLAELVPRGSTDAVRADEVIQGLVAARWVWSDPLADPGMRLNGEIADGFKQLSRMRRSGIVELYDEAERYRNWVYPLTCVVEG